MTIISHAFGKKWPLLKIIMLSDHWLPNEKQLAAYVLQVMCKVYSGTNWNQGGDCDYHALRDELP